MKMQSEANGVYPNNVGKNKKILVVDDEPEILMALEKRLSHAGYQVFSVSDGINVLAKVKEIRPDIIILDIMIPGFDGIEIKRKLNADMSTAGIPVIFLTARDRTLDKVEGLQMGVDDYITKPFDSKELLARINSVLNRRQFYENISMTDGLTGVYNVSFFKKQFPLFFHMAKRYKRMFSLAIIDINNLKDINDRYGHTSGDFVLKKIASAIKKTSRKSDIITRYGGDEFAVILPESDEKFAAKAMERVREKINSKKFFVKNGAIKISFSVSIGTATYSEDITNENQLFELADANMYNDKVSGR